MNNIQDPWQFAFSHMKIFGLLQGSGLINIKLSMEDGPEDLLPFRISPVALAFLP